MADTASTKSGIENHPVVDQKTWYTQSEALLAKEKEFTRMRDEVSKLRRALPWVRVETEYTFDGPEGKRTLAELFDGKGQLIIYHFMYGPGWDEGCPGCSFVCDHVDAARQHFDHHDIAFAAISRAQLDEFLPYKKRMGWSFPWLSSNGNEFNYDFGVTYRRGDLDNGPVYHNFTTQKLSSEEQFGLSVFVKDEKGDIYRTYSSYERGLDLLIGAYNFIDLTPLGRNEKSPMDWMSRHDQYED